MKAFTLVLLILGASVASFRMPTNNLQKASRVSCLTLTGVVEGLDINEENSTSKYGMSFVSVQLKLRLTNAGKIPIILPRTEPQCNEIVVAKRPEDLDVRSGRFLAYSSASSSEVTSAKWLNLRESLNQTVPPSAETQILYPGDSFDFDGMVRLDLPKQPEVYASSPTRSESLHRLQELSPLVSRVRCRVWPVNLEGVGDDRAQLKFGRTLQERWKDVGLLWLDDIFSEPIMLELKTTRRTP